PYHSQCVSPYHAPSPRFFSSLRRPPHSPLFPYTTLFRSPSATHPSASARRAARAASPTLVPDECFGCSGLWTRPHQQTGVRFTGFFSRTRLHSFRFGFLHRGVRTVHRNAVLDEALHRVHDRAAIDRVRLRQIHQRILDVVDRVPDQLPVLRVIGSVGWHQVELHHGLFDVGDVVRGDAGE